MAIFVWAWVHIHTQQASVNAALWNINKCCNYRINRTTPKQYLMRATDSMKYGTVSAKATTFTTQVAKCFNSRNSTRMCLKATICKCSCIVT